MNAARWSQIDKIFQEVAELAPRERPLFLDRACGDDQSLRQQVESLLSSDENAANFLESPLVGATTGSARVPASGALAGKSFGPYDLRTLLGSGGMGEVYLALDSKLKRHVAIKVLPEVFSCNSDRVSRFQREAEVLASLNNPHIAAIYDLANFGGLRFLVLELVEGETLADRIARGAIPINEVLRMANQIAEALEVAHEKGIIHRDLKPANIKIVPDGDIKVLDFGLAKVLQAQDTDVSNAPTRVTASGPGMYFGTPTYMSPEQARGTKVGFSSDVWAFGCVFYEMLTAHAVFKGQTDREIFAGIFNAEPDWRQLPAETPEGVRRLLRRCLEKNEKLRCRDIRYARLEINDVQKGPQQDGAEVQIQARAGRSPAWMTAAAAILLIAVAIGLWTLRSAPSVPEARLEINTPASRDPSLAISPDGLTIVFAARSAGQSQLWVRSLDSSLVRPLAGTERASSPFWSPDSRSIGFFADAKLKRIDIERGAVQTLTSGAPLPLGGAWNSDGTIVFSMNPGRPIFRISAEGGAPSAVTRFESPQQRSHSSPQFLPDGQHFLFFVIGSPEARGVYIGQLDGSDAKRMFDADAPAVYAATGHLLFIREGKLLAQDFDPDQLKLVGDPFPIAEHVPGETTLSASAAGPIAYRTPSADSGQRQLVWVDRSGKEIEKVVYADTQAQGPSVSRDGSRVAVFRSANGNTDIWSFEKRRRAWERITFDSGDDIYPLWSPDSRRIVFGSRRGEMNLYWKLLSAPPGSEELLLSTSQPKFPMDWSADARFLVYDSLDPKRGWDIWALPLDGDRKPFAVVQTDFNERLGQFSPDGTWIAYQSDKSGRFEIYVRPFPDPGSDSRVSIDGGAQVRWNPNGKELFYIGLDDRLMAVPVRFASNVKAIEPGTPVGLFGTNVGSTAPNTNRQQYAVSPDGQSFVMNSVLGEASTSPIMVILNWKPKP